jgi:hypothetical protein
MTGGHENHKIMSLASSPSRADNDLMTIIGIPPANPAHAIAVRRDGRRWPKAPIRTLPRRLATWIGTAVRDRQPMVTLSEQALADIHNVHSVSR